MPPPIMYTLVRAASLMPAPQHTDAASRQASMTMQ
eukprot:CAMPEP_0169455386 /NCGR_PEP_ID=MMETSP1042-20121227/15787_1 /TAXON_ID=464988 /ORGANISM="Hemiselmis andersenii, Strain CCMP1180" /LENGTH=34 /DNA_ID= /DNA_START= /DNA_END= /DNA_ORIENTATION=